MIFCAVFSEQFSKGFIKVFYLNIKKPPIGKPLARDRPSLGTCVSSRSWSLKWHTGTWNDDERKVLSPRVSLEMHHWMLLQMLTNVLTHFLNCLYLRVATRLTRIWLGVVEEGKKELSWIFMLGRSCGWTGRGGGELHLPARTLPATHVELRAGFWDLTLNHLR